MGKRTRVSGCFRRLSVVSKNPYPKSVINNPSTMPAIIRRGITMRINAHRQFTRSRRRGLYRKNVIRTNTKHAMNSRLMSAMPNRTVRSVPEKDEKSWAVSRPIESLAAT